MTRHETWLDAARGSATHGKPHPEGLGGTEVEWDETAASLADYVGLEYRLQIAEADHVAV